MNLSPKLKRQLPYLFLMVGAVLLMGAAASNRFPLRFGHMETDLDAGANSITNIASLLDTNGNAFAGGSAQTNIAVAGVTNAGTAAYSNATAFALATHTHVESDVTSLVADLAAKQASLGYTPLTNSFTAITNTLGYLPATNGGAVAISAVTAPSQIWTNGNSTAGTFSNNFTVDAAHTFTATTPTLVTPTIASFANATHSHQNAAGGGTLAEGALSLSDVTTLDVSTTKHGLVPKAPNDATKFLDGTGAFSVPASSAGVWVKQVFKGGFLGNVNTLAAGTRNFFVDAVIGNGLSAGITGNGLAPTGGYLTNFQAWSAISWPTTTNIVFTIKTNTGLSSGVATPITCTLNPSSVGGATYTNSATTSLILPTTQNASGYTWMLEGVVSSPGGALVGQSINWSVEWWHQSP